MFCSDLFYALIHFISSLSLYIFISYVYIYIYFIYIYVMFLSCFSDTVNVLFMPP